MSVSAHTWLVGLSQSETLSAKGGCPWRARETSPVQAGRCPPGGPCPGYYYQTSLAIRRGSLSRALALRRRLVDTLVSRERCLPGANTGSVAPQPRTVVGRMVYRLA